MTACPLDPSAFLARPHATRRGADVFVGQSRFDGHVTIISWPRDDVAHLLPPELALASAAGSTPPARHPVAVVFGTQTDSVIHFARLALPGGPAYHEVGVAIPFVTQREGHASHVYMARMYASYPPAVWAGNVYYGFSKELADVRWDGKRFDVNRRGGARILQAAVEGIAEGDAAHAFETVRTLFRLPVLGRRRDGSLVCSHFDWDVRDAQVRQSDVRLSLDAALDAGAPVRCSHVPGATYALRGMRWRLSWPVFCAG